MRSAFQKELFMTRLRSAGEGIARAMAWGYRREILLMSVGQRERLDSMRDQCPDVADELDNCVQLGLLSSAFDLEPDGEELARKVKNNALWCRALRRVTDLGYGSGLLTIHAALDHELSVRAQCAEHIPEK